MKLMVLYTMETVVVGGALAAVEPNAVAVLDVEDVKEHALEAVPVPVEQLVAAVPEPAREAAAVVPAPVPEAVSIPVRESVIQHVLLRIRRN